MRTWSCPSVTRDCLRVTLVLVWTSLIKSFLFAVFLVLRTLQKHKDLFVISEDDLEPIHTALAGTQYISVVLFQVQTHIQEKIIQLYQDAPKLSFVCLFHECFVNAVCFDLITAVCTALGRHLGRVRCISRYQDFTYAPFGQTKKVTKSIYFIMLHSSFTTCGFEVISQNLEYAETWLCNSAILTSTVQERIKSMSGVVRFRVHRTGIPVQTTLGVTDRCCITFCISVCKIKKLAGPLEQVYQNLRTEAGHLEKQELQRVVPLIWISGKKWITWFLCATFANMQNNLTQGYKIGSKRSSFRWIFRIIFRKGPSWLCMLQVHY